MTDHNFCFRIPNDVLDFGQWMRRTKGNRYSACLPDSPLHSRILKARGNHEGNPSFPQIGLAFE